MIWNLFDFPSGVVKFGVESGKNIDSYNHENDFMLRVAPKVSGVWNPSGYSCLSIIYFSFYFFGYVNGIRLYWVGA